SVNGYLFLGKNITKKNVFVSFSQKFANDLPDNLEIFLLKKTIGKKIVEQKEYIYNQLAEYNLANIVGNDVHYIDDIIWDSTMTDDSFNQPYKRDDFIDQKLYKDVEEGEDNNGTLLSEESIKLFLDDLDNDNSSSISVVSGSGGVGKTTFCDTLKYAILREDKIRKKVFYIKGERVVEFSISDSDNKEIRSLDDLYDLYREDTDEFNNISSEDFKLNFIIGNIVVIIDAIEEIESAFKERFNLKLFFKSLKLLHERFLRTKIIVTTREHFVPKIKEIQDELFVSMDYYKLRGFEQSNLEKFLKKKYKSNENKAQEANRFIEDNRLFYDNHIIPLFVDWVCQIIDRPDQNFLPSSKYLIVNESKDKLLINLLQREIKKQSLNVNVDEMFELLESIVIDYNGSMPQEDFSTHVEVLSSQDISNHLKNPLLINENNKVRIRYDILPNLIKSRSLLYSLAGEEELDLDTNKITLILKDCYQGQGEIFNEVVRICKQKKLDMKRIVTRFIRKLKKSFKNETKEIQKENMRKSTSALLHLLNKIQSPSDRSQRMLMIKDVYELAKSNTLSGLYIYGDFEALDFSNVTISDSHFDSYMNFHKSKFPEDSKVVFYHTKFKKFNIPQTQHIKNSHFDSSCIFTDCNIDDITNINLSKENKKIEQLKKDIITLISFIDTSQRSLNLIKQKCSISYSKGIKKLVDILLQKDFLILVEKSTHNQDLYKINQNFYDEIPNIKLGNFPPELEIMLEEIVK
ncbi:MAG: NACHT domain-containing protein, partial [Snowella sp.]|nr:NACHT domain-containing protein [Snowella sp.]